MKIIDILVTDADEDQCLRSVDDSYEYAVVYREGHKFLDRERFLKELDNKNFFIFGHILDREGISGYYELHKQCYVIHIPTYKRLGCPAVGQQSFHDAHTQISPCRSDENYHDDYTPWWVQPGKIKRDYMHKAHGWNILSIAFENNLPVLVFNSTMRNAKEFNYEAYR